MTNENSVQNGQQGEGAQRLEQRLSVDELKQMAEDRTNTPVCALPTAGEKIPKNFDNPPPGHQGHKCVDLQGLYRPDWSCLRLHESDGMPDRQMFRCAGPRYTVRVGEWVDVPPDIMNVLKMAEVASVKYEAADEEDLAMGPARPVVVGMRPRFNYTAMASA